MNERRQAAGQVQTANRARAITEAEGIGRINYGGWRNELVRAVTLYWLRRPRYGDQRAKP